LGEYLATLGRKSYKTCDCLVCMCGTA